MSFPGHGEAGSYHTHSRIISAGRHDIKGVCVVVHVDSTSPLWLIVKNY